MAEHIWTVMGGVDASRGDSLSSVNQKIFYPWEPDVIQVDGSGKKWPGGHSYTPNEFNKKWSASVYAWDYDGSKKSQHIHHKYAAFHGEANHIGEKINKGYSSPGTLSNSTRQIIGYHMINLWGHHSKDHGRCRFAYANYSTSKGTPLPVYGLTFDFTVCQGAATVNKSGDNVTKDTGGDTSCADVQIDKIHGLWAEQPGALNWYSALMLPNGDNWGDDGSQSDPANGKYIFYNHGSLKAGGSQNEWLGSGSQSLPYVDGNKKGGDKPYTIKAMLAPGEAPPKNYLFMGFTMSFVLGHEASIDKNKQFFVSNVGIIDKANWDVMKNKPEYHGINPSKQGLKHIVLPRTLSKDEFITAYEINGPRPNW